MQDPEIQVEDFSLSLQKSHVGLRKTQELIVDTQKDDILDHDWNFKKNWPYLLFPQVERHEGVRYWQMERNLPKLVSWSTQLRKPNVHLASNAVEE